MSTPNGETIRRVRTLDARRHVGIEYPSSRVAANQQTLAAIHCALIERLKRLYPGCQPRLVQLAEHDRITLRGVSAFAPSHIVALQRVARLDYVLVDDCLTLYVSRVQHGACYRLTAACVRLVLGLALVAGSWLLLQYV